MRIIIILFIITLHFFIPSFTDASNTSSSLTKAYNNFLTKLETKFELNEQLKILNKVKVKVDTILKTKKISTKWTILLKQLNILNNNKIQDIEKQLNKIHFIDQSQIELEKNEVQKLKNFPNPNFPNYILELISNNNIKFLNVVQNQNNPFFEFYDNWKVKRLIFTNWYIISDKRYSDFKSKNWYIVYYNWEYLFIENWEVEEKIPYSESVKYFKSVINNNSTFNYFLNNWTYYYYKLKKYNSIDDKYWFYLKSLKSLWLDPQKIILNKIDDQYVFITEYTEEKLINSKFLKNVNNKDLILSLIYDDVKNLNTDTDKYFQELQILTENLTNWLSKDDKIKAIYAYILENISYTNPIDLDQKSIFSWIETFKNKNWICGWYTKLMAYMLIFSWIEDIEVIWWYVINAPDFPKLGHAWLKIWDYYYDPTFDDPIWNTKTLQFNNYMYFKLPWDLFYTNRYDLISIPEEIKSKSKDELNNIVNLNLYNLASKYKNSSYKLMKHTLLLYNSWLSYNEKITVSTIKNILTTYDINWNEPIFEKDWVKKYIKGIKYHKLDDNNIIDVLRTIDYELTNKYIFKWNFWDWTYEYRLIYELELY